MLDDNTAALKPVPYSAFDVLPLRHVINAQVPVSLTVVVCHLPQRVNSSGFLTGHLRRNPARNRHRVMLCIAADCEDFISSYNFAPHVLRLLFIKRLRE